MRFHTVRFWNMDFYRADLNLNELARKKATIMLEMLETFLPVPFQLQNRLSDEFLLAVDDVDSAGKV